MNVAVFLCVGLQFFFQPRFTFVGHPFLNGFVGNFLRIYIEVAVHHLDLLFVSRGVGTHEAKDLQLQFFAKCEFALARLRYQTNGVMAAEKVSIEPLVDRVKHENKITLLKF